MSTILVREKRKDMPVREQASVAQSAELDSREAVGSRPAAPGPKTSDQKVASKALRGAGRYADISGTSADFVREKLEEIDEEYSRYD